MENLEDNYKNEDEISLLDLLSVFVKYRKLIIWGTVVFALLVSIFLFFLSKSSDNQDQLYLIDYNINIYPNMDIFKSIVSFDIIDDTNNKLNNKKLISEINKNILVFDYDFNSSNFDVLEYNQFILELFNDKEYLAELSKTKNNFLLSIKTINPENSDLFVNELINVVNNEYREFLLPLIQKRISEINLLLPQYSSDEKEIKDKLLNEKITLTELSNENFNILQTNFSKFIVREKKDSLLLKIIIVWFASFFIFIFIAFLLNAIQNIKSDKEASTKIKNAWEKGKKLFP